MPADERATYLQTAKKILSRWLTDTCQPDAETEIVQALKEADRLAREDAAKYHDDEARKIAALRPDGVVWTAETLNAKLEAHEASATAIRASITTAEGE